MLLVFRSCTIILTLLIVLITAVFTQNGSADRMPPKSVVFHIRATKDRACIGENVLILGQIQNAGKNPVGLYAPSVWSSLYVRFEPVYTSSAGDAHVPFSKLLTLPKYKMITGHTFEPQTRDGMIVLRPGEKLESDFSIRADDDFFQSAGTYEIEATYRFFPRKRKNRLTFTGEIKSNKMTFQLNPCTGR